MEGASRYEPDRETSQQNQDGPHCPDDVKSARQACNFKNARSMGLGDSGGNNQALEEQHILVLLPVHHLLRFLPSEVRRFLPPKACAVEPTHFTPEKNQPPLPRNGGNFLILNSSFLLYQMFTR